ncbi:MAG: carboxypeptidase-like regulatory domain-containing protein, partial [Acidobacteria bacterium]|nr:carboxypeptidase-like regulatory domain-containing protein [Acidobacteriota bacterium]
GQGERLAVTDREGRFRFDGVPTGRYLVRAIKVDWVPAYYGSPRPGRPPGVRVAIERGAKAEIEIPITPGSVIAGRVVDPQGRPMARQFPWLLESRMVGDRRMISRTRFPYSIGSFERSTNDLGEFRLFGLPPGTYYLALSPSMPAGTRLTTDAEVRWALQPPGADRDGPPSAGPIAGYARLYYPGTPDPDAAVAITVGPGQVREGLEFRLEYSPVGRIEGVVHRADGAPATGVRVNLEAREPRVNLEGSVRTATVDAQGRFVFNSVPADDHRVSAYASSGPAAVRDLWAQTTVVTSGADVTGVMLTLAPAAQLSGRVSFAASTRTPPADLSVVRLTAVGVRAMAQAMAGGGSFTSRFDGQVAADGTFQIKGLPPDRYLINASWPGMRTDAGGWWLTGVRVGERNLGDEPVQVEANEAVDDVVVEFRDRMGAIEGALSDAAGRPAPGYVVMAFPVDRAHWTTSSRRMVPAVRPATDGRFTISGLPGGDYYLAVVTEVDPDEAADGRFLETLIPMAIRVVVPERGTVQQALRIGGGD